MNVVQWIILTVADIFWTETDWGDKHSTIANSSQARNQLETPGERRVFWNWPKFFLTLSNSFQLCPTHFSRGSVGQKHFRGQSPPASPLVTDLINLLQCLIRQHQESETNRRFYKVCFDFFVCEISMANGEKMHWHDQVLISLSHLFAKVRRGSFDWRTSRFIPLFLGRIIRGAPRLEQTGRYFDNLSGIPGKICVEYFKRYYC